MILFSLSKLTTTTSFLSWGVSVDGFISRRSTSSLWFFFPYTISYKYADYSCFFCSVFNLFNYLLLLFFFLTDGYHHWHRKITPILVIRRIVWITHPAVMAVDVLLIYPLLATKPVEILLLLTTAKVAAPAGVVAIIITIVRTAKMRKSAQMLLRQNRSLPTKPLKMLPSWLVALLITRGRT